jgi:hypothetical protein
MYFEVVIFYLFLHIALFQRHHLYGLEVAKNSENLTQKYTEGKGLVPDGIGFLYLRRTTAERRET